MLQGIRHGEAFKLQVVKATEMVHGGKVGESFSRSLKQCKLLFILGIDLLTDFSKTV